MRAIIKGNPARAARTVIFLAVLLALQACTSPDRWHDLESLYAEGSEPARVPPIEPELLPVLESRAPLHLRPEAENDTLRLSLEQAVTISLQGNRELRVERHGPVIAGAFEEIERGTYDPELFAGLEYAEERVSETARSTGEQFSVEAEEFSAELGMRQRLPTGTDLEAGLGLTSSTSNRTPKQREARIGLSVTQSLLRGFGPAVNLLDIRQARLSGRASLYELRGFAEALVAEIETAYWRHVLAGEGIRIYEHSLAIARQQLDEVEKRIEVGVLPRNAAAAARAEVARREQALIDNRSNLEEQRLRLLRLLNIIGPPQPGLRIEPTSQPRTEAVPLTDQDERLALADRLRPDLNEARLRRDHFNLELVRTRNGLLPKLDLFIDLGKTGYAESFGNSVNNLDDDNYELAAGIRFSTYLGRRESEGRDLVARASREQAVAAIENLRSLVELDVRLALNEAERTRRQIEASAVTRQLQAQTLEAEQEKFSIGTSTSLLVAQAQRDLLLSELAEIEAVVDYRIALVNLFLAEGSLLERRGIRLPAAD